MQRTCLFLGLDPDNQYKVDVLLPFFEQIQLRGGEVEW